MTDNMFCPEGFNQLKTLWANGDTQDAARNASRDLFDAIDELVNCGGFKTTTEWGCTTEFASLPHPVPLIKPEHVLPGARLVKRVVVTGDWGYV